MTHAHELRDEAIRKQCETDEALRFLLDAMRRCAEEGGFQWKTAELTDTQLHTLQAMGYDVEPHDNHFLISWC